MHPTTTEQPEVPPPAGPATTTADAANLPAWDRWFELTQRGSDLGRELRGGLVTFVTMAYIVVLNPLIMGTTTDIDGRYIGGGDDPVVAIALVSAATALVAGILTLLMGAIGRFPLAIAAGLGLNSFLAYTIAPLMTWPQAMGLIVLEGLIIGALVLTGFRTRRLQRRPRAAEVRDRRRDRPVHRPDRAGGRRRDPPGSPLDLVRRQRGAARLAHVRVRRGPAPDGDPRHPPGEGRPADRHPGDRRPSGGRRRHGVGVEQHQLHRERRGHRRGCAHRHRLAGDRGAVPAGDVRLPLVSVVPYEAATPALVIVGFLMMTQIKHIPFDDYTIGIPAFLTIIIMPFTYSIANGIGAGMVTYTVLQVATGRARQVAPLMWIVAVAFTIYFAIDPVTSMLTRITG